jgi:hypothetical protein
VSALALASGMTLVPGATRDAGASSISADRHTIASIESQITTDGLRIQRAVIRYDQAETRESFLVAELAATARRLSSAQHQVELTRNRLRTVAVESYVTGGSGAFVLAILSSKTANSGQMNVYENVAASSLSEAVTAYVRARHEIARQQATLRSEHTSQLATLRQIARARAADDAALAAEEKLLASVKGNLRHLLAVRAEQRAAQERLRELALQHQEQQTPPPPPPPPPPPSAGNPGGSGNGNGGGTPPPTGGGYANPLRAINGLSPERIDQGVDYSGFGPIYAIGPGVVLNIYNAGWPGGTFIVYQLSSGPAEGLYVYAAEDISPSVQIGQTVTSSTVLGTVYEGPDGIETGWADGSAGDTMAMSAGQFSGANSTAFGANFSDLLASVGAPPGILQNDPPTGTLPSGWPTW